MKLILPQSVTQRLITALRKGGQREVGGILMAEHIGPNEFRVADLTVQLQGGTFATFIRFVDSVLAPLRAFFTATGRDYSRFNYIGEWHSHHSFQLTPSRRDDLTMLEIVSDPSVGGRFAVLLIVRLNESGDDLQHSLSVYLPTGHRFTGLVVLE